MDMNAHYGGLNAAFVEQKKTVWVMNVVPVGSPNTLPLILDQGFAGVLHDWYAVLTSSLREKFHFLRADCVLLGPISFNLVAKRRINLPSTCRCEPFPTYPRTYDLLHANGLLSQLLSSRCSMLEFLVEMDRILRPEVLVLH